MNKAYASGCCTIDQQTYCAATDSYNTTRRHEFVCGEKFIMLNSGGACADSTLGKVVGLIRGK